MAARNKPPIVSLAQQIMQRHTLWFYLGSFYLFGRGAYTKLEPGAIENLAFAELTALGYDEPTDVKNVVESLKQQTFLASDLLPPFYIRQRPANAVVFSNGTLDIDKYLAGDPEAFGP